MVLALVFHVTVLIVTLTIYGIIITLTIISIITTLTIISMLLLFQFRKSTGTPRKPASSWNPWESLQL